MGYDFSVGFDYSLSFSGNSLILTFETSYLDLQETDEIYFRITTISQETVDGVSYYVGYLRDTLSSQSLIRVDEQEYGALDDSENFALCPSGQESTEDFCSADIVSWRWEIF